MATVKKRKADAAVKVDWSAYERRPFKRGFIPYQVRTKAAEASRRREAAGIEVVEDPSGEDLTPAPVNAFEELGVLPHWVKEALTEQECFEPTPIQAQALPICVAGQNFIGIAPSGSGQAFACLLPAIVHIEDQPHLEDLDPGPIALVLAATPEVATQMAKQTSKILKHSKRADCHPGGIRVVCIHEGGSRKEQLKELGTRGAHVVIGTVSRVHDMASKDQLPLLRVTFLVLEELDRILELGFLPQVKQISNWIRPERQMTIFSSTWPKEAHDVAGKLCFPSGMPVHVATTAVAWESMGADGEGTVDDGQKEDDAGAAAGEKEDGVGADEEIPW